MSAPQTPHSIAALLAAALCHFGTADAAHSSGGQEVDRGTGEGAAQAEVPPQVEAVAQGPVVEYELHVREGRIERRGKSGRGLSINGQSPAPTLRFTEGDWARVTVHNHLEREDTSTHWHGLLVPNLEDGVPYLTTPPIWPGEKRVFEFPIRQSGTYWYHSHSGLQEQEGLYGAIVIEPKEPRVAQEDAALAWDREHVVVLSDWTHESPQTVMRTLMQGSEWYSIEKGNGVSVLGAWRAGKLGEYFRWQRDRMRPMDLSDVAYDAFLAGGEPSTDLYAEPGERVLLRLVNAGASTYFHLGFAGGPFHIIASDGQDVVPVEVPGMLMAIAETYDVLVTVPESGEALEFRATAHDGSGFTSVWLGQPGAPKRAAESPPKPDYYSMDEMVRAGLASQIEDRGREAVQQPRPFAPYTLLRANQPTDLAGRGPVRKLTMRLTGDMRRYIWSINGKTLGEEPAIPVAAGEVLQIELINDTMMHHPMHLHGHFFRLVNGQGDYAPLKHTVDVPPMGKRTIEWIADEEAGDWFFHCHLLYHMDAGMARVFSYRGQGEGHEPKFDSKLIRPRSFMAKGMVLDHMFMGMAKLRQGKDDFFVRWMTADHGGGHGGAHGGKDEEVDFGYSRYVDENRSWFVAYRTTRVSEARDRAVAGFQYRFPYMLHSEWSMDSEGDARIELEKSLQLTPRLSLSAMGEYDTLQDAEWGANLEWTFNREFGLVIHEHSDHGFGFGVSFQF